MNRSVGHWQLFGFAVTALGGTVLHFLYEWLGKTVWIAPFSGVNESTWEHMKLFFWPTLLFAVIQRVFFSEYRNFWCVKLRGMLLGLLLIPVLFYTYNGVIGKSPDWLNIAIFFLSAAAAYAWEAWLFVRGNVRCRVPNTARGMFVLLAVLFVLFTFLTPRLGIFRDPLTGTYGISQTQILPEQESSEQNLA